MGLQDRRDDIVTAVKGAGYKIENHAPSRITPPIVVLVPGDPYVSSLGEDDTFSTTEFLCRFTLNLIVATGSNSKETTDLDNMIQDVIGALGGWGIENVAAPFIATVGDSQYFATTLTISSPFNL